MTKRANYDKAIADCSEAIRLEPESRRRRTTTGAMPTTVRANTTRRSPTYTEAIRLDPKLAMAYNNRGIAYDEKGEYDKAIADCSEAIRLDPKTAAAYSNRGLAYADKGDSDKAIAD